MPDLVRVEGPDAATYLQGQLSQDIDTIDVGSSAWSFVLSPTGHIDGLVEVTHEAPETFVLRVDHGLGEAVDLLVSAQGVIRFAAAWIDSPNLHGTGCTLSSAIAAGLARGLLLEAAVGRAKTYLTAAIAAGAERRLGRGSGPLDHWPDRARRG